LSSEQQQVYAQRIAPMKEEYMIALKRYLDMAAAKARNEPRSEKRKAAKPKVFASVSDVISATDCCPFKHGKWSKAECSRLVKLVERHGENWTLIQDKLNRKATSCERKYSYYTTTNNNAKKGNKASSSSTINRVATKRSRTAAQAKARNEPPRSKKQKTAGRRHPTTTSDSAGTATTTTTTTTTAGSRSGAFPFQFCRRRPPSR
jgi:Myb-like DNA-binding domain